MEISDRWVSGAFTVKKNILKLDLKIFQKYDNVFVINNNAFIIVKDCGCLLIFI